MRERERETADGNEKRIKSKPGGGERNEEENEGCVRRDKRGKRRG